MGKWQRVTFHVGELTEQREKMERMLYPSRHLHLLSVAQQIHTSLIMTELSFNPRPSGGYSVSPASLFDVRGITLTSASVTLSFQLLWP